MSIPFLDGAVAAVYPAIASLVTVLSPIGGATTAIVVCTVALRLLLLPLTMAAVRGERARALLAPRVQELQRRHGKNPQRLQAELAELYQSAGSSPLSGCLPMLAQSPFFMVWYRIFTTPQIAGGDNVLLSQRFLGATLSTHLLGGGQVLAFVPLLLALLALALFAMLRTRRVAAAIGSPAPSGIIALLPLASVVSALVMPLAAVVYLVATMSWTAVENVVLRRGLPAPAGR